MVATEPIHPASTAPAPVQQSTHHGPPTAAGGTVTQSAALSVSFTMQITLI